MNLTRSWRAFRTAVPVLLGAALVGGCSTPHPAQHATPAGFAGSSTPAAAATSTSPAVPPPTASSAAPQGLSRSAFVATANSWCAAEASELSSANTLLHGPTTVPAYVDRVTGVLNAAAAKFTPLVAAQPDHEVLERRWLQPRVADYAVYESALAALKAAALRGDYATLQADGKKLDSLPSHDATIKPFLLAYGLTRCA